MSESSPQLRSWPPFGRISIAWACAAVIGGSVAIVATGAERFQWLTFALGLSALLSFGLQLGSAQREGFIVRTSLSVAGSVAILSVITLCSVWLTR